MSHGRREAQAHRLGAGLAAAGDVELAQDRARRGGRRCARRGRAARRSRALRSPLGDQREHLELARASGRPDSRGCARTRAARQPARPALAQPPGDDRRRGPRPEPLQLVERPAQRLLLVGVRERERRLVGAAELAPSARPPAATRRRAGARTARRRPAASTGESRAPAPVGQLAGQHGPSRARARAGARPPSPRRRRRGRRRARRPRLCAAATCPSRGSSPVGSAQRPRLVERRRAARVAAPRADEPEHDERDDARRDRGAGDAQDGVGGVGRLRPAALVELHARALGEQVEPVALQAAVAAVVDPRVAGAGARGRGGASRRRAPRTRMNARPTCSSSPARCARSRLCSSFSRRLALAGADRGERVDGDLGVAEALRQLERAAGPAHRLLRPSRRPPVPAARLRVRHRELAARRQSLEQRDRLASRALGARRSGRDTRGSARASAARRPPRAAGRAPAAARAPPRSPRSPRRSDRSGSTRASGARAARPARRAASRSPKRSARSYCAAASRYAPSEAARAAAAGA